MSMNTLSPDRDKSSFTLNARTLRRSVSSTYRMDSSGENASPFGRPKSDASSVIPPSGSTRYTPLNPTSASSG